LTLAVALADSADARAVGLLLPLLGDATPRVRQRAAGAVGSLGAAGAAGAPVLTRLLDDPDPGVALTASAALLAVSPLPSRPAGAADPPDRSADGSYAHG
jgi:HEAT repeat protein